jgi:tRNA(Arg) A34 adenosine deaminase TadA
MASADYSKNYDMNGFIEILPVNELDSPSLPPYIEAWVVTVKPQECSALVQWLSQECPLQHPQRTVDLSHLKRVKRVVCDSTSSHPLEQPQPPGIETMRKRTRSAMVVQKNGNHDGNETTVSALQVLIGAVVEEALAENSRRETVENLLHDRISAQLHRCSFELSTVSVPRCPPQSEDDFQKCNAIWPTVYLPNQMQEYQERQRHLTETETDVMHRGMESALDDFRNHMGGVLIYCPTTGRVVATSSQEFKAQQQRECDIRSNPLVTPYILAIQGVSRIERTSWGSETLQYLCTGYDVYGVREPTAFEAMALVHSRIRRLVFGVESKYVSGSNSHRSGIFDAQVHGLPGTNHHFRAFTCAPDSDLWERCKTAVVQNEETTRMSPL